MPLAGIIHPLTRERVPLDKLEELAFDTSWRQGRAATAPWLPMFIRHADETDERHKSLRLTGTGVLACPRQVFAERMLPYYVTPVRRWAVTKGTAMHEVALRHFPPFARETGGYVTEATHPELCKLEGVLWGGPVVLHCDGMRLDAQGRPVEIFDLKFPSDFSVSHRERKQGVARDPKTGEPDNGAMQLNEARLLLAQQEWAKRVGYDPDDVLLTLWDHSAGKDAGPEPLIVPHVSEGDLWELHPGGGQWTLGEMVTSFRQALAWCEGEGVDMADPTAAPIEVRERAVAGLPLVGADGMYGGQCCTLYCDVAETCGELVRRYGPPESGA